MMGCPIQGASTRLIEITATVVAVVIIEHALIQGFPQFLTGHAARGSADDAAQQCAGETAKGHADRAGNGAKRDAGFGTAQGTGHTRGRAADHADGTPGSAPEITCGDSFATAVWTLDLHLDSSHKKARPGRDEFVARHRTGITKNHVLPGGSVRRKRVLPRQKYGTEKFSDTGRSHRAPRETGKIRCLAPLPGGDGFTQFGHTMALATQLYKLLPTIVNSIS